MGSFEDLLQDGEDVSARGEPQPVVLFARRCSSARSALVPAVCRGVEREAALIGLEVHGFAEMPDERLRLDVAAGEAHESAPPRRRARPQCRPTRWSTASSAVSAPASVKYRGVTT